MKIEINGKTLLALSLLSASIAFGDFVSVVDHKTSGGMLVEKETMVVGSVVFRMDDRNPSTIYGGTWELIKGDASLYLGDGTSQTGLIEGSNIQEVPLLEHSHSMNHSHASSSSSVSLSRLSSVGYSSASSTNATVPVNGWSGYIRTGNGTGYGLRFQNTQYNQSLTVKGSSFQGNTSVAGKSEATMDVSGAKLKLNVWQRVS